MNAIACQDLDATARQAAKVIARRFQLGPEDRADMRQDACLAMLEAGSVSFLVAYRQAIDSALRISRHRRRVLACEPERIALFQNVRQGRDAENSRLESADAAKAVREAIRDTGLIGARFLELSEAGYTFREIGREHGVSGVSVCRAMRRALAKAEPKLRRLA
jgi:DNA-directed RNA polymerase specialized sigma24 family protein